MLDKKAEWREIIAKMREAEAQLRRKQIVLVVHNVGLTKGGESGGSLLYR